MKRLNKTETSAVCFLFPKTVFLTFIREGLVYLLQTSPLYQEHNVAYSEEKLNETIEETTGKCSDTNIVNDDSVLNMFLNKY